MNYIAKFLTSKPARYQSSSPMMFEDTLTQLQKMNKVLYTLGAVGESQSNTVDFVNDFAEATNNEIERFERDMRFDYMPESVRLTLDLMTENGEFQEIIENSVIPEVSNKVAGEESILNFDSNGNDWTLALQEAADLGLNVYIPKGYTFEYGSVEINHPITIYGGGRLKKKVNSPYGLIIKHDNVRINDIEFDSNPTVGQPSSDIRLGEGVKNIIITNNTFKSPIYSAISAAEDSLHGGTPYLERVKGIIISNNTFENYARPLYLHSVDNYSITSNIFTNTAFDAIRTRENDGYGIISLNQFINIGSPNASDNQTRDAIDTYWAGETLIISNNIVKGTMFAGFDIKGVRSTTERTRKVIIQGNQIENCRYNGMHLYGDVDDSAAYIDTVIITGNVVTGCNRDEGVSGHGISIRGCGKYFIIQGNQVTGNKGRGIFINNLEVNGVSQRAYIIQGNIVTNNGHPSRTSIAEAGICLRGVDGFIITDNFCENDMTLPNPYQNVGIYVQGNIPGHEFEKTGMIKYNVVRNNLTQQIITDANGNRADNVKIFTGNIQVGPGAVNRPTWQNERGEFWGVSIPATGDGVFEQGSIIKNIAPVEVTLGAFKVLNMGWQRVTPTGSSHVLGTDWKILYTITGVA